MNREDLILNEKNVDESGYCFLKNIDFNDLNLIKKIVFENFKNFIGGLWNKSNECQIKIEKLSGGLCNYLYLCSIDDKDLSVKLNTNKAVLRIYGETRSKNVSNINEIVISAIVSCKGIGPKLYGILPFGRIEEYIPSKHLIVNDLYDLETSSSIARSLSKFHSVEMPFSKEPKWFFDKILSNIKEIETNLKFDNENDMIKLNKFKSYNLREDFKFLSQLLNSVKSPVVFSHIDFHPGNLLKRNDGSIVLIDYEYANYNFRGFDIGNIFCEWMMVNHYHEYPYFKCNYDKYPNREQQLNFIRAYLESNNNNNQTENENDVLLEVNYFALASHFFWSLWATNQVPIEFIQFSYLDYALTRMDLFQKQKEKIKNGIIPPVLID